MRGLASLKLTFGVVACGLMLLGASAARPATPKNGQVVMPEQPNFYNEDYTPSYILLTVSILSGLGYVIALRMKQQPVPTSSKLKPKKAGASKADTKKTASAVVAAPAKAAPVAQAAAPKDPFPRTQREIDEIPPHERGASFFTSRPIPLSMLCDVAVFVGNEQYMVRATEQERDQIIEGRTPLIRAFTSHGETRPWFGWANYDPFTQYARAAAADWLWLGTDVIACWVSLEELAGYGQVVDGPASEWAIDLRWRHDANDRYGDTLDESEQSARHKRRDSRRIALVRRRRLIAPLGKFRRPGLVGRLERDRPYMTAALKLRDVRAELVNTRIRLTRALRVVDEAEEADRRDDKLDECVDRIVAKVSELQARESELVDALVPLKARRSGFLRATGRTLPTSGLVRYKRRKPERARGRRSRGKLGWGVGSKQQPDPPVQPAKSSLQSTAVSGRQVVPVGGMLPTHEAAPSFDSAGARATPRPSHSPEPQHDHGTEEHFDDI